LQNDLISSRITAICHKNLSELREERYDEMREEYIKKFCYNDVLTGKKYRF